jgi:hypothetical protein
VMEVDGWSGTGFWERQSVLEAVSRERERGLRLKET